MNVIPINRLNLHELSDINYSNIFDNLCSMSMLSKMQNVNELKKYCDFMKSKNWINFFVGDHEITLHDINNIKNYYDTKYLVQNQNNEKISSLQKNFHVLYDTNNFILLDSFVFISQLNYIFVDLCWCNERGIRIFNNYKPIIINCIETEV